MKISEQLIISQQIEKLQHSLQLKFGLAPGKPSRSETIQIIEIMREAPDSERTDDKWLEVVNEVVEPEGIIKYEGIDFSSANNLLDQIDSLLLG